MIYGITFILEGQDDIHPPNKSPEPTAVIAVSPLSRAAVSGRLWLSFHR
jgi:hypothetical protein